MSRTTLSLPGVHGARFVGEKLLAFSPEGLWWIEDGKARQLPGVDGGHGPLELSADGRHAYVGTEKKVLVIDLDSFAVTASLSASGPDGAYSVAPSPNGARVLVVGGDEGGTLKCFESGKSRAAWTIGGARLAHVAWLDDDMFVVASSAGGTAIRRRSAAKKGALMKNLAQVPFQVHGMCLVDGAAVCATDSGLLSFPTKAPGEPEPIAVSCGVPGPIARVGNRIIVGGSEGIDVVDVATRAFTKLSSEGPVIAVDGADRRVVWVTEDHVIVDAGE